MQALVAKKKALPVAIRKQRNKCQIFYRNRNENPARMIASAEEELQRRVVIC